MRYRFPLIVGAAVLAVALTAWTSSASDGRGSAHGSLGKPVARGGAKAPAEAATAPILYSQYDNLTGLNIISQDFDVQNSTFSEQVADDFTVTGGQTWKIQQIDVAGVDHGPGVPMVTVEIFADAGGVPGSQVAAVMRKPTAEVDGDLVMKLGNPGAITLTSGTYWLSVYADMDFFSHNEWFWAIRSVQSGSAAVYQNPGNGWGTGCTGWSNMVACQPSAPGPDLVFDLRGHLVGS